MGNISDKELKKHLYISIICGGTGTRLWPRSRKANPKQFITIFGKTSGLQKTINRVEKLVTPERIFMVTNFKHVGEVLAQDEELHLRNIISEPMKKNTALAMAISTVQIMQQDPEAVVINLPSDHLIEPDDAFVDDMKAASRIVWEAHKIAVIGIKPIFAHTGYGYINFGEKIHEANGRQACRVIRFTEKPDLATAKRFIKSGKYYWNAGLFVWKASLFMEEIKKHAPKLHRLVSEYAQTIGTFKETAVMRRIYKEADDISIDYALAEKSSNLVILPASFRWDDVGDWKVVYQRLKKDKLGTAFLKTGSRGELIQVASKNNLVQINNRLVALVGVENLAVIDMDDVVLICPINRAQEVKKMVSYLKEKGRKEYL